MATLTRVEASILLVLESAATGGDEFPNDEDTVLIVENTFAGARTITIPKQRSKAQPRGFPSLDVDDIAIVFAAAGIAVIRAAPAAYNKSTGKADITYSPSETGVNVKPVHLPRLG